MPGKNELQMFAEVSSRYYYTVACSRLSESGEDAKVKGTRKFGGAGKRKKGREGVWNRLLLRTLANK